jgi:hypothetical protein
VHVGLCDAEGRPVRGSGLSDTKPIYDNEIARFVDWGPAARWPERSHACGSGSRTPISIRSGSRLETQPSELVNRYVPQSERAMLE